MQEKNFHSNIWIYSKSISLLLIIGAFVYKFVKAPISINISMDFPTLLSLIIALFSVVLAILFYFKATETSNTFYNNTYTFSKHISELLVKIESSFGEKLHNLNEGYSDMKSSLQSYYESPSETKEQIEGEKSEAENLKKDISKLIKEAVDSSTLGQQEKNDLVNKLEHKDQELTESNSRINDLEKQLFVERLGKKQNRGISQAVDSYTKRTIIPKLNPEIKPNSSLISIKNSFNKISEDLPDQYIVDLANAGLSNDEGRLTSKGASWLRLLALN